MKKDTVVSAIVIGALAIFVALGALALALKSDGNGKPKAKPLTTEQKLQTIIDAKKTAAVASARVVICKNAGAQTIQGKTVDPTYACPVLVTMKNGTDGCVGVLATDGVNGSLAVVAAPANIDPQYCK